MNLIAEIEGQFKASLYIITTEVSLADVSENLVTLIIPKVVTRFSDLRSDFPNIFEADQQAGFPPEDQIVINFRDAADAATFRNFLLEPNTALKIRIDKDSKVISVDVYQDQVEKSFIPVNNGTNGKAFPRVTLAAIYNFMPSEGSQKVFGQHIAFHDMRSIPEISLTDRIGYVGDPAIDVRRFDAIFARPKVREVTISLA